MRALLREVVDLLAATFDATLLAFD